MDFYTTAAQVIPTLFIAMALGGGILVRELRNPAKKFPGDPNWQAEVGQAMARANLLILIMIFGEVCALAALTSGKTHRLATAGAWAGLIAGLLGVALPVAAAHWARADRVARVRFAVTAVAMAFAIAVILDLGLPI